MKLLKRIAACLLALVLMGTSIPAVTLPAIAQGAAEAVENVASSFGTDSDEPEKDEQEKVMQENEEQEDRILPSQEEAAATTYAVASNEELVLPEEGSITRAAWLHNLVVTFEMIVETTALPDNYFSDLSEDHEYYEDILLAVEFGVVDIEAGGALSPDEALTRDFAASTLNFCLGYQLGADTAYTFSDVDTVSDPVSAQIALNRGWVALIEGAFAPETLLTSAEAREMLADAAEILAGQIVDAGYESKYEFAEGVIVISDGTAVTEKD